MRPDFFRYLMKLQPRDTRRRDLRESPKFLRLRVLCGSLVPVMVLTAVFSGQAQGQEERTARLLKRDGLPESTSQRLDVGRVVAKSGNLAQAKEEAGEILKDIVATGDAVQATHVMTYARVGDDRVLVPVIRERLKKVDGSWHEQHVKMGAMHALIVLEGEKFPQEIEVYLKSADVSLKSRAFMLVRDSGDARLAGSVKAALVSEGDPAVKAAGLSALARLEGTDGPSRRELERLAMGESRGGGRARIELNGKGEESLGEEGLSPEAEERFRGMVLSGRHDERMHAIERLAAGGREGVRSWLRGLGTQEDWKLRMTSAYYLLAAGEKEEALRRVDGETHGLVQVTLLAAVRAKSVGEGGQ
jgi:hypothetical protein